MKEGARYDKISKNIIVLTIILITLMYITMVVSIYLVPFILLLSSAILRVYVHRLPTPIDKKIDKKESNQIVYVTIISLLMLMIGNLISQNLYVPEIPTEIESLSISFPYITTAFVIFMAIAETIYFHGELLDFFRTMMPQNLAAILIGIFGIIYHFGRYGTDGAALFFVFIGFTTLAWAANKTRRILVPMLTHTLNNIMGTWLLIIVLILVLLIPSTINKSSKLRKIYGGDNIWTK